MSVRFLLLILITFSLTACLGMGDRTPAPVTRYGQSKGAGSAGVHNVINGDTLYSISQRYRLPMRDIAVINHLSAPFRLSEGQRLLLPPPQEYRVQQGDTLYDVSRLFGVNSSEIVRLNNLQSPYALRVGQLLRLPSVTRKRQEEMKIAQSKIMPAVPPVPRVQAEVLSSPAINRSAEQELRKTGGFLPKDGVQVPSAKQNVNIRNPAAVRTDSMMRPPTENAALQRTILPPVSTKSGLPERASSKFLRPVNGQMLSSYGAKETGLHNDGINISAPRGTPVKSAENGIVVYAGNALKGSGNLLLIRHDDDWVTAYAHMDSIAVKKGDVVRRGQTIGQVGATGSVSEPQLHFEIRRGTTALNPVKYME